MEIDNIKLKYEYFIRDAFALGSDKSIDRWGDQACLANANNYSDLFINSVKVAIGYAMEIYNYDIMNDMNTTEKERERINNLLQRLLLASNINEITPILDEYITTVRDRYYPN